MHSFFLHVKKSTSVLGTGYERLSATRSPKLNEFLVSKETACGAASVGGIKTNILVLSNELIKVEVPP